MPSIVGRCVQIGLRIDGAAGLLGSVALAGRQDCVTSSTSGTSNTDR